MSAQLGQLEEATIAQNCKALRMPAMAQQFRHDGGAGSTGEEDPSWISGRVTDSGD